MQSGGKRSRPAAPGRVARRPGARPDAEAGPDAVPGANGLARALRC